MAPDLALVGLAIVILAFVASAILVGGWGFTIGRVDAACCARCKYPTEGLRGDVCPECGGDLRGRGMRRPGARVLWRPPAAIAIACRSVVMILVIIAVLGAAREHGRVYVSRGSAVAGSGSKLFTSIHVSGRGSISRLGEREEWLIRVPRLPTTARLHGPKRTVSMRVLDGGGRVRFQGPDGWVVADDAFPPEQVLRWMEAAGVDVTHERAAIEAVAIRTLIWNVAADGTDLVAKVPEGELAGLANLTMTTDRYRTVAWWYWAGTLIPAAVGWVLLIRGVLRWNPPAPRADQ